MSDCGPAGRSVFGVWGSGGFSASGSVATSMAGFATPLAAVRPQPPGARRAIPAAFRYRLAVSRRTPVVCSIRRSDQPSRPRAITCCFFSSLKTLLTLTERNPPSGSMSWLSLLLAGFQVATYGRFWVATEAVESRILRRSAPGVPKRSIPPMVGIRGPGTRSLVSGSASPEESASKSV